MEGRNTLYEPTPLKEIARERQDYYSITVNATSVGTFDDIIGEKSTYKWNKNLLEKKLTDHFGISIPLPSGIINDEKEEEIINLPRNPELLAEVIDILCEYNFDIINVDVNPDYFVAKKNLETSHPR